MRHTFASRSRAHEWDVYARAERQLRQWRLNQARAIEARSIAALMLADEQVALAHANVQRIAEKYNIR